MDRNVLASGHRHGASHQPGDAVGQQVASAGTGRRDADQQADLRDDAVIDSECRGAPPADAVTAVTLVVAARNARSLTPDWCVRAPTGGARRVMVESTCVQRQSGDNAAVTPSDLKRPEIMMPDRIWLQHYPCGVPAEIDADRYRSIPELFAEVVARYADRPAFHSLGRTLGYRELDGLSRDFAAFLQGLPGLRKGERVAIMSPNLLQYPVALFGILRAGMIVVNVNPLYTARELEHQLRDSGARAIVVVENFAATLQQVWQNTAVQHVITTQIGDLLPIPRRWLVNFAVKYVQRLVPNWRIDGAIPFSEALARGAAASFSPAIIDPADLAFLQYTGGTTGVAKGAMLSHRNMLANLQQTGVWISGSFKEGSEIVIAPLPMYHIFCLTSTLSFMQWGSLSVLITNPRDLPALVRELGRWPWSVMSGVNTLFNGLLHTPGFSALDFSSLKVVIGGGAAIQQSVAERWKQVTGRYVTEAYGLTEASPGVSATPLGTPWNGMIGLPLPSTVVSIRDEHFNALAPWTGDDGLEHHTGEICVRGPQVMTGYWGNPEETAAVMEDGWFKTGDIGHLNGEGYLTITDRKKDLILVSGFNVYPSEIESVVASHPGVLECGAVGVPDERTGEAVKVVIVRKDPQLTREAVVEHCRKQLTGYKLPRQVEFRDTLPKSPIGKILRRELRGGQTS
jgi:long-chain acyl-CoA synthetase